MTGDRPPHINAPPLQRTAGKQKARQTEKTVCRACMLSAVPRLHGFAVPRKLAVSRVLGLTEGAAQDHRTTVAVPGRGLERCRLRRTPPRASKQPEGL